MVAITTPPAVHRPRPTAAPRLRVVAGRPVAGTRPAGRIALAAVLLAVLAVAALYLVQADPVPAAGTVPVLDTHTVGPGETMWSIAGEVAPAGEAAAYVERLVDVNGTARVAPGQVITLPVP